MVLDVLWMLQLAIIHFSVEYRVIKFLAILQRNTIEYIYLAESNLDGSLTNSNPSAYVRRDATETCINCVSGTWSDPSNQR